MIIRQPYPNELYHHGIKGMNWGVRRFQNEDGSLTEAGRRRYGIFGRLGERTKKRKVSRAAKIRAKQRTKAKTDEAKKAALEAETARLNAQREAEEAKAQLRAAKKENSLLNRAVKALPKKEPKEKPVKESKNSKKLAAAIEAGNDKKVSKLLESLDNEEYAKALERINMKYEMSLAKKKYSTDKMKQTVDKLNHIASGAGNAVSIYNVVAGVASAVSGKDVPKISTAASDPLKNIEQMYKNKKAKAEADKAESEAKAKDIDLSERNTKHQEFMKERQTSKPKPKEKQESKSVDDKLSNEAKDAIKDLIGNKNKSDKKRNPLEDFITPGAAKDMGNKNTSDTSSSKPKREKKYKKGQNITEDNWGDFFEQMNEKYGPKVKDSDILNARIVNPKRGKAAKDDPNKRYGQPDEVIDIIPSATFLPAVRPNGQIDVSSLPRGQQDMFWRFMNGA